MTCMSLILFCSVLLLPMKLVFDLVGTCTGCKIHAAIFNFDLARWVVTALLLDFSAVVVQPIQLHQFCVSECLLLGEVLVIHKTMGLVGSVVHELHVLSKLLAVGSRWVNHSLFNCRLLHVQVLNLLGSKLQVLEFVILITWALCSDLEVGVSLILKIIITSFGNAQSRGIQIVMSNWSNRVITCLLGERI